MNQQPRPVNVGTLLRLARPYSGQLVFGLLFCVVSVLIAVVFAVAFSDNDGIPEIDFDKVSAQGKSVPGILTQIETQENVSYNEQHPAILSYRYSDGSREVNARIRTLNPEKISRMNVGDTITIKYLGDQSLPVGFEPFSFPVLLFMIMPAIFLIIGIVMLFFTWRSARKEIYLFRYGIFTDATLISMHLRKGDATRRVRARITVDYEYESFTGQKRQGESFTSDLSMLKQHHPGDRIKIFVSPDDETITCLIPTREARANNWVIG
jgi:hypothetical protein